MKENRENRDNKKWLQELYAQAPVAIGIYIGKEHIIEFANPMMCQIWGRPIKEVINRPMFEALPEVREQGFEEILAEVMASGEPFVGNELPATLEKQGHIALYYFNILYKPLRNEQDEIIGIIQVANDVTSLVEARRKAERSEETLKSAIEAAKMGTWHYDLVQKKATTSKEHDQIYGYKEELSYWDFDFFLKHVVAEDREEAKDKIEYGLKKGALDMEVRIQWPNKSLHWIHLKGKVSYNLKKQPVSVAGIVLDISDQKHVIERERQLAVEQAARKEAERQGKMLENLFMEAPALICTLVGPDHIFGLVNPLYQQLFSGRELKGKPVLEALPEINGQPFKAMLDGVYKTGKTFIGKETPLQFDRLNTGKLELGYFNFIYQANRNASGEIIGILVFAFEVTEQIISRKNAERSEENLKLALEAGNMGTWQMDFKHSTSLHSIQFEKIFGYQRPVPNWGYKLFMEHIPIELREEVNNQFREARKTGELNFETSIMGADQQTKWIAMRGKVFFENQRAVAMAGIVQDISERKVAEEQLKQLSEELAASNEELRAANEEIQAHIDEMSVANHQLKVINADLDNFIYTASHDLKAPIANIEGLMNLLVRNLSSDSLEKEVVKKIISSIKTSVDRFKKTIGELTDIAKLQKQMDETSLVNVSEIVQEVLLDLQTSLEEAGTTIEVKVGSCLPIQFSYKNIKSVVYNLISNAIKYRSPDRDSKVEVGCKSEDNYLILTVKDNGLGIKKKDLSKIFSMFTRMHTHVEGTGVGLYLVKRIVDNAGGELEVDSEEGIGTTFKVMLPSKLKE